MDGEENISPIIKIFERLTFERGHEVHDLASSMIELFSLSNITLDMLDTLIDCIKVIFVHENTCKNTRILDFLITITYMAHINYTKNRNLSLVFDALIDMFSQSMVAVDSQIRSTTFQILNKLQSLTDLSRSPFMPDHFEQYLLELLNSETTLLVLDQLIPLGAKFQHKNPQFIDAFISRINSPKLLSYVDRRHQIVSLLEYSSSSLNYLLSTIETDNDLSQIAFESLLAHERGFTLEKLDIHGRLSVFQIAHKSRDLSRLIFTRWISQNGYELIDIIRLCNITSLNENKTNNHILTIETSLKYFLDDKNIRRIVLNSIKQIIGTNKGGLLPSNIPNYIEYLFIWRILCQLINEEDDNTKIHPDFHEFIAHIYRLVKVSVNKLLSSTEEFIICQYLSILSTFDVLDIYRRKCIEAISRCMLVHFGQFEIIIQQALRLIYRIHSSKDSNNERYQLITYTLNDIIKRCQDQQHEELTFIQCMTIAKVFIQHEKELELNNTDLKPLLNSLIKSGLSHKDRDIQIHTLTTLKILMCHSKQAAIEYIKHNIHITNKIEDLRLKCELISTFIDVLLIHGLEIFTDVNLLNMTASQFIAQHLSNMFDDRNIEIKQIIVFGLIKLFLSSRLEPTTPLLRLILDYRFSNDYRLISQNQRDDITSFFYFFIHLSRSNVLLMEELTFDLVSRYLPFVSDNSTIAYRSISTEPMCYFCVELLSLPSLPIDKSNEEHSHYHLAINLLESIHNSVNNRTDFIIKSYLNTIKHLEFQYMKEEQLEIIFDAIIRLRQYSNLPSIISNSIKHIEDQIQSNLRLIKKLTNGNHDNKRSRSPSPSSTATSQHSFKRVSSIFKPSMTSSPNVLRNRTNHMISNNNNQSSTTKGIKRKSNTNRYTTLDFENDSDDFF